MTDDKRNSYIAARKAIEEAVDMSVAHAEAEVARLNAVAGLHAAADLLGVTPDAVSWVVDQLTLDFLLCRQR